MLRQYFHSCGINTIHILREKHFFILHHMFLVMLKVVKVSNSDQCFIS